MAKRVSVADKVMRWSTTDKLSAPHVKDVRFLPEAHRFTLDDEFVRAMVRCTVLHPDALVPVVQVASNLPYKHTWLEFSLHAKVSEARAMGTAKDPYVVDDYSDIPPRMGVLLSQEDGYWSADTWVESNLTGGEVVLSPIQQFVGSSIKPSYFTDRTYKESEWFGDTLQGFGYSTSFARKGVGTGDVHPLEYMGVVGAHPAYFKQAMADKYFRDNLMKLFGVEASEQTGMLRFLSLCLAMVNEANITKVQLPSPGRTFYKGRLRPLLSTTTVTINVPNNRTVVEYVRDVAERSNAPARKLPEHPVRGHWRKVQPSKVDDCKHLKAQMISSTRRYCPDCEFQSSFVRAHKRGDPDLKPTTPTPPKKYRLTAY